MLTVGVDLGKRNSQYAVKDDGGCVVAACKLPNRGDVVRKFLRGLPGPVQVACETCVNTYWLVELVEEMGLPISVGHALKLRLIAESRQKTDKVDAGVIADLKRANFFPKIAIPPKEIRDVRELLRGRVKLGQTIAQFKNRVHGVLTRAGVDYERSEALGLGAEAWLEGMELRESQKFMARMYLGAMRELQERLKETEKLLKETVRLSGPWKAIVERLQTIPGVGEFSAMLLVLELWDIERFASPKKLASYVGIVPSTHQTGQTLYGGRLTKQGNRYVRWILIQDAWAAVRSDRRYHGMYEHYRGRHCASKAIVPVARQILTDVYDVWTDGITYEELLDRKERRRVVKKSA